MRSRVLPGSVAWQRSIAQTEARRRGRARARTRHVPRPSQFFPPSQLFGRRHRSPVPPLTATSTTSSSSSNSRDAYAEEIEDYTPGQRLSLCVNAASFVCLAAALAAWAGHEDPLGGLFVDASTLPAAALGVGFGLPLAACSVIARHARVRRAFPVMAEMHAAQRAALAPFLRGMSPVELAALAGCVVLAGLMLLLPGFTGGCHAAAAALGSALLTPRALLGPPLPDGAAAAAAAAAPRLPREVAALAPSVLSAWSAGYAAAAALGVRRREVAAVGGALAGAERYFRLAIAQSRGASAVVSDNGAVGGGAVDGTVSDADDETDGVGASSSSSSSSGLSASPRGGGGGGGGGGRGASAAAAFRLVAGVWLLQRYHVSRLAFGLASLSVTYLYIREP